MSTPLAPTIDIDPVILTIMPRQLKYKSPTYSIQATSTQTRFHFTDNFCKDLDLTGLYIQIGRDKQIITDSHLKLNAGVHYVLIGRNGVGKSTLLKAVGEKLVPGIPKTLNILWLEQGLNNGEEEEKEEVALSALEFVIGNDKERTDALRKKMLLSQALESSDVQNITKVVNQLKFEYEVETLEEARKDAALRSGTRGMKARKELRLLEAKMRTTLESLDEVKEECMEDMSHQAIGLLEEIDTNLEIISSETVESRARKILYGLGFTNDSITKSVFSFSSGWKMRIKLASVLLPACDILLLDEPTNFLDFPALIWLEDYLRTLETTLVVITHDREFADALADELIVLRDSKLEYFNGNLTAYEATRSEQQSRLTRMKDAQDRQKEHMEKTIAGHIRAAKASGDDKRLKQAASRQKKLDERMGYQVGLNGGRFKLNRDRAGFHNSARGEIEIPTEDPTARLSILSSPPDLRFPGPLISAENICYQYSSASQLALKNVTLTIHPDTRLGIVGLNGSGKTTLVTCLIQETTDINLITGTISHHPRVRIGYFSQATVDRLPLDQTALSLFKSPEQDIRAHLSSLGLYGSIVSDIPISMLSGGQKVRLALALITFPTAPHLLVLDEVTTHLDPQSIVMLVEQLNKYQGAIVIVSHDRWFLKRAIEQNDSAGSEGKILLVQNGEIRHLTKGVEGYEKVLRRHDLNTLEILPI